MIRFDRTGTATVLVAAMVFAPALAGAGAEEQVTQLISTRLDGTSDASAHGAAISQDGRFVAFSSRASNVVANDTNEGDDVFVADRRTGVIERVSVASDGSEAAPVQVAGTIPYRPTSWAPSISADGRLVAFHSDAPNLVPGDDNAERDVFVHDRQTGATILVSAAADGTIGNGPSGEPAISADGRWVAFETEASNLTNDTNDRTDIVVKDLQTGAVERISVGYYGEELAYDSYGRPAISADGRFVTYLTSAAVYTTDQNGVADLYVRDRQEQISIAASTDAFGNFGREEVGALPVDISADGSLVLFRSPRKHRSNDTNGLDDIYMTDLTTGEVHYISLDAFGQDIPWGATAGSMSDDGRFVAFQTAGAALPADENSVDDVYMLDRTQGTLTRASVSLGGGDGNGISSRPAVSGDGAHVAFESSSSNMTTDDDDGIVDIFARGPALAPVLTTPVITAPVEGDVLGSGTFEVAGTADAGTTVRVLEGEATLAETPVDGSGAWSTSVTLTEGAHTVRAIALDGEHSSDPSQPVHITVDLSPVIPTIVTPRQGRVLRTPEVAFEGAAGPGDYVEVMSGETVLAGTYADATGSWSLTATLTEGDHAVIAQGTDDQGRVERSDLRSFSIDVTAPSAPTIDSPTEGAIIGSRAVTVDGSAEPGVTVTVRSGTAPLGTAVADEQGVWATTIEAAPGEHAITAIARDDAGNLGPSSTLRRFTVDVDDVLPVVTVDNDPLVPVVGLAGGSIVGSAGDDRAVVAIEVTFTSTLPAARSAQTVLATCDACPADAATWSASIPELLPGRYRVTARAFDAAGNASRTATQTLIVA